ncbi:MAG: hypothetical protein FWD48_11970 [Oscillospiraceae bacterium]|nr:hypothetical protein [Oscillospiraceae bacterium]
MGQIFHAIAYDIENKTCCVMESDKFHANCYSFSGAVKSIHYLLRQKAYNVMWGGDYVAIDGALNDINNNDVLLGISVYKDFSDFERNDYEKVKYIDENNKLWNKINVWNDAREFFGGDVKYMGFLLNHTQKLAVDLFDFYGQSKSIKIYRDGEYKMAIDAIPVLTETGGGSEMAFFDGISVETTENLAGTWCGNLLQISDDLPKEYSLINCCFADIWTRAEYLYQTFGLNEKGLILNDTVGKLFEATRLSVIRGSRGLSCNIKVEITDEKVRYIPVMI